MNVSIIGTGNTAHILGRIINEAGHHILEVVGRNSKNVEALSGLLNTVGSSNINNINTATDLIVVAVSDGSIADIVQSLKVVDKLVVHTAASVSINVLKSCSTRFGVIYPVQSLKKEILKLPAIPVLIDGCDNEVRGSLFEFASTWADGVSFANDDERLKLHIGAVIVNNFVNHLFTVTEAYCRKVNVNFAVLYPLIEETIARLNDNAPSSLQTGPAIRNDVETIEKHLSILTTYPEMAELYKFISKDIIKYHSRRKE